MESNYLVSVIIPVHNTAPYLHKCVESVRNQSLKEIEIILVENMSIDNSAEICDEYAKIDSRIKVIHLTYCRFMYSSKCWNRCCDSSLYWVCR